VPRFLVRITVALPPAMPADERAELLTREEHRGSELKADGTIQDMWRLPGRLANVGLWRAPSTTALHAAISSLPVWPWTSVEVEALADHCLTSDKEDAD
jgi:muconolactone D-isomerase